jgi:hypothetical protein
MAQVVDREWLAQMNAAKREDAERRRAEDEAKRREDVERLRKEAQDLGQKLMDLRQERFGGVHASRNPNFVADPDIDILEIRYQRVVRELEEKDQE